MLTSTSQMCNTNTSVFLICFGIPCAANVRTYRRPQIDQISQQGKIVTEIDGILPNALAQHWLILRPLLVQCTFQPLHDIIHNSHHLQQTKDILVGLPEALQENFFAEGLINNEATTICANVSQNANQ